MTILFFLLSSSVCSMRICICVYFLGTIAHTRIEHRFSEEIWVLIWWWWWGFSCKPDAENIHINQMTPIKSNHYSMAHISFWFFLVRFPAVRSSVRLVLLVLLFVPLALWYSPDGGHFPNFRCIFMHRNQMDKAHGFLHHIYCPFDENMEVLHLLPSITYIILYYSMRCSEHRYDLFFFS